MKNNFYLFLLLFLIVLGCKPAPVHFFSEKGYIKPYKVASSEKITFVLGDEILNSFEVSGSGLKRMKVDDFRKSLELTLYYTFEESFKEVSFQNEVDNDNLTVVLYRIRPSWEIKSSSTSVVGVEGTTVSNNLHNVATLIRYDGIVLKNGVRVYALDNAVLSEKTSSSIKNWKETFKDAVKILSGDIYRTIVTLEKEQ
ncbi:MAG: hypothetical protein M3421_06465 [Bacteroidota bacterium]|nr:hypothetical protein [Bacteroidota bacterium]